MIIRYIKKRALFSEIQIQAVIELTKQGATVPFIARYRKERTRNLDEVAITEILSLGQKFNQLEKRKKYILDQTHERNDVPSTFKETIEKCEELEELEDLYLPYKVSRKTKASVAKEKGLEPLAKIMMSQGNDFPEDLAKRFSTKLNVDASVCLEGARHIIAEWISERVYVRKKLREFFSQHAFILAKQVKGAVDEGEKFKQYYDFKELARKIPSHRFLAVQRGVEQKVLKMSIEIDRKEALSFLENAIIKRMSPSSEEIKKSIKDAYTRLLKPSLENAIITQIKKSSDLRAIEIFASNLKEIFMMPPIGEKRVLAIDPGYRTGCKLVCLDANGKLLHNETIYPNSPQRETKKSMSKINALVSMFKIDAIAIGNGTASRETEELVKRIRFSKDVEVYIVNEAGASIYSVSKIAREEFPDYDVTVRGAVSIGRRLQDPLAELVKLEPKSIGVGQYQHAVDQQLLKQSLDNEVMFCVNKIGVNLNSASSNLLKYVAGLGPTLAQNIVDYRNEHGAFESRASLLDIPKFGKKTFEQAAGFLRVKGRNVLDNSAIHPERYSLVKKIVKDQGLALKEVIGNKEAIEQIDWNQYSSDQIGQETLLDIKKELLKPGRDPRKKAVVFEFDKSINKIEDLELGMKLPGIVNNVTNFGAFIDIGIKENGLLHLSEMADRYIAHPSEVVKIGQQLTVKIVQLEKDRKRIGFSLK